MIPYILTGAGVKQIINTNSDRYPMNFLPGVNPE
jgi:hypothetical protein